MFKKTLLFALATPLFFSCVSKKKYETALSDIDRLQSDSAVFHKAWIKSDQQMDSLLYDYESYRTQSEEERISLLAQLDKRTEMLSEKDKALEERAAKLRALQEEVRMQNRQMDALRSSVRKALVNIPSKDLSVDIRNGRIYINLSENLLFASGSASLDPKGRNALKQLADVLQNNEDIRIEVVGHTDSIPIRTARFSDNWDLSVARATSIVRILVDQYGLDGKVIKASGKSEYDPVADNRTPENQQKNRRTEIILSPNIEELYDFITE